jgi:opacity protein-like surface antigen
MRSRILTAAFLAALLAGAANAEAASVTIPYAGNFDEATIPAEGGLPAGDYDTIGGLPDVGLFNLIAGSNTFTGSAHTPSDSSDAFLIGIGPDLILTGASIVFGTNVDDFNPMFILGGAAAPTFWTLEESSATPTIFSQNFSGGSTPLSLTAPAFSRGAGIYSLLIGNGVFGSNNGPINYTMTFNVISTVATTPIPAALPLFATAFAGLGFIGWRRKRNNAGA